MCTFSAGTAVTTNGVGGDWGIDGIEERRAIDKADVVRETGIAGRRWEPLRGGGGGGAFLRVTGEVGAEFNPLRNGDKCK